MLAAGFRAPDPVQLPLPFSTPLAAAEDEADEELLDCRRPPELPPLLPLTVPAPLITLALPAAALGAPGPIRLPLPISTLPAAEVEADEELLDCSGPPELPLLLPLTPGSPSASAGLSHALDLCGGGEPLHGSLQFAAPVRESAWMARPPLPPFPHHPLGGGYRRHGWLRVGARAAARSSARCLRRNPQTSENRSAFLSRWIFLPYLPPSHPFVDSRGPGFKWARLLRKTRRGNIRRGLLGDPVRDFHN